MWFYEHLIVSEVLFVKHRKWTPKLYDLIGNGLPDRFLYLNLYFQRPRDVVTHVHHASETGHLLTLPLLNHGPLLSHFSLGL